MYVIDLFTKRHQESWKREKDDVILCPCYLKLTVNRHESSVCLKRSCLAKKWDIYTSTQSTLKDMKRTTKQVDEDFYLAICQVPLTGILRVDLQCLQIGFCSICMQHVTMTQCVWGLIQCTLRGEPKQKKISVSCVWAVHSLVGAQKNRAAAWLI